MFGRIIVYILFVLASGTAWMFFYSYRKNLTSGIAEKLFYVLAEGIVFISLFLMGNIYSHNFQYTYIWDYSSSELPTYLLIASFYAGNEGSFLLWALLFALLGFFLMKYVKKIDGYENLVMGFYSLLLAYLLLILIVKSPFEYLWETFSDKGMQPGFTAKVGRGLNPILQKFWLSIHPPILFTGYVAIAIPFIFAMTALIKKDFTKWVKIAYPWALAASAILGLGIMLGGFWAYETLGWGGFWGWDPVENSSLLPWLSSIALCHTLIIQRKSNSLIKTNLFLAILTFLLVLYATFLTRSGILGDMSVHSFTNPGATVYYLLLFQFIAFGFMAFFLFVTRVGEFKSKRMNLDYTSREFLIIIGTVIVLLITGITFIGTNMPLINELLGNPKTGVELSFYNNWNLPLTIMILLTNAISLYMSWNRSSLKVVFKKTFFALVLSVVATAILIISGLEKLSFILLTFSALVSLFVNLEMAARNIKSKSLKAGGNISHIGISIMIIGIIAAAGYTDSHIVTLKKGVSKQVLGYTITLTDKIEVEKEYSDRQKFLYRLKIESGGNTSIIDPIVYWSDFNQRKSPIIEPGIKRFAAKDIYVVLKSADVENSLKSIELTKDSSANFKVDTNYSIKFIKFDMSHGMVSDINQPLMGAFVQYNINGMDIADTLYTKMGSTSVFHDMIWKKVNGTKIDISFLRIISNPENMSKSLAVFAFKKSDETFVEPSELLTMEISVKPYINLVWLGVLIMITGFGFAIVRSWTKKRD